MQIYYFFSEPVPMCFLFILKDRWREQFRRVAVGELGKVFLILPHKIHDVTQTLNVQHIALQHVHQFIILYLLGERNLSAKIQY